MILLGADTHKHTHTLAAVNSPNGEFLDEKTAAASKNGFIEMLDWARGLGETERVWALEDCRHVSGPFERYLIAAGERVLRVPPNLTARERGQERTRGKSDPIDARAIARAALREGIDTLPAAHLDASSLEIKLLLDHREDLTKACSQDQQRLRWHLHDLWPEFKIPKGALDRQVWLERIARKLTRAEQSPRVRVARDLVRSLKGHTRRTRELICRVVCQVGVVDRVRWAAVWGWSGERGAGLGVGVASLMMRGLATPGPGFVLPACAV
jgi:transposase